MKTPTFQEQYNKIVGAYMRDELKPWNTCACFIGNMLNGKGYWAVGRLVLDGSPATDLKSYTIAATCVNRESNGLYTYEEIIALEHLFLKTCNFRQWNEDTLYEAMEKTLLALRHLHELKGEIVSDYTFTKKDLLKSVEA